MQFLRIFTLLVLVVQACWAADSRSKNVKKIEATVSISNVPPISYTEETISKNEKRESADQLANFQYAKNNDEPFRPMLPPNYRTDIPTSAYQQDSYLSAAAATPQIYYDNAPFKYSDHLKENPKPDAEISYASSAYRTPFTLSSPQATQPSQQQHEKHQQQQEALNEVASSKQVHAYVEDMQSHHAPSPPAHTTPQLQPQSQQQFQYVIAIPLSYVRRLQQQLEGGQQQHHQHHQQYITPISPQHQHPQEQSTAPGKHAQLVGPLARDHQGMYRPYQVPAAAAPDVQYVTRYIQVPINSPLLYQKPQQLYPTAPAFYQQAQPQMTLYTYPQINQPQPQAQPQHALPAPQQQQQHQVRYEPKQQQQRPEAPTIRYSAAPSKPTAKLAGPPNGGPSYSSMYVTPSPVHPQYPLNYVRFAQPPNVAAPYSLPPFLRLPAMPPTAASSLNLPLHPSQHYYALSHPRTMVYPMQTSVPGHVYTPQDGAALPYFNHPAGVHYGTHLYHPQAMLKNSPTTTPVGETQGLTIGNQQQQEQQQQQQHPQTSYVKHPAGNGYSKGRPSTGTTTVPPAGATKNIVEYP